MSAWLSRHIQTFVGALGRLGAQPLATLLTMLVIGIALALPACLHLFIDNAQKASTAWDRAIDLSIYLQDGTSVQQARSLTDRMRQRRDVAAVELVTAEEALKEFRRESGFGAALDVLGKNPLPHTLVVTPRVTDLSPARLESLAADLRAMPHVDVVQLDSAWVQRLDAILNALERGVFLAAALLGLGVMVIVGNTIRLDIFNRRDEIEITKLVGGSDGFVRRPFLYTGVWYGFGGGVLAAIITLLVVAVLTRPVTRIAGLYGSDFRLHGLNLDGLGVLLGAGMVLGWIGSFLAASRHLRDIEPH